ncbi:hypothetical protein DL98DRAFT_610272 [Cadophora sp. DSE1049]|nr:hypothetical protein DL98DRAFT_610272 [Cadophora sp. DSE1049]
MPSHPTKPSPTPSTTPNSNSNSTTTPQKCHYTLNAYICRHKTWPSSSPSSSSPLNPASTSPPTSKTPRIIHTPSCPFSSPSFSSFTPPFSSKSNSKSRFKANNANALRCPNMEKSPRINQIPELCPKCRPFTLGTGGKRVRGFEVEVPPEGQYENEALECRYEGKGVGVGGEKGGRDGRGGEEKGDEHEDERIQSDKGKGESKRTGIGMRMDPHTIPSAANGSSEVSAPSFSIVKRVLGMLIPGSGTSAPVGKSSELKLDDEGGENAMEKGKAKGGKEEGKTETGSDGRNKDKQSWHKVDHDPDWEIVGREKS